MNNQNEFMSQFLNYPCSAFLVVKWVFLLWRSFPSVLFGVDNFTFFILRGPVSHFLKLSKL